MCLFFVQNTANLAAFVENHHVHFYLSTFKEILLFSWGTPWALIAVVGAHFAYLSYHRSSMLPFSQHLARRSHSFFSNELRRLIDLHIQTATKFFLLINLVFIVLQMVILLFPHINLFNTLYSILISSVLFLVLYNKSTQKIINRIEHHHVRQGFQWILLLIILVLTLSAIAWMSQLVFHYFNNPFTALTQSLVSIKAPALFLLLFNWCWWLLGTPLLASLLIKYSVGRTVRQFLFQVMLLPVLSLSFIALSHQYHMHDWFFPHLNQWIYLPTVVSLLRHSLLFSR